jgi:signal transduction histidine kinase
MSLGLPIEDWLQSLAELAKHEEDPERFLALACSELPLRMPGVMGGDWEGATGRHAFGVQQGYPMRFKHERLTIGLVSNIKPSPSLLWYYGLSMRLLAEFHLGKWRAQELRRLSYVEAIHATGARLTHDVKNLLQSLDTLCVASQQEQEPSRRFTELLRRQLPEISMRLRQTLTKLSAPDGLGQSESQVAESWFASLESRYGSPQTVFAKNAVLKKVSVPDAMLFSSVAENLLHNFANKQKSQPGIKAEVRLGETTGRAWLEVTDNGAAIPAGLAAKLLAYPVPSESGLGVGLYQSARLAEQRGYRLELTANRDGCVGFRLA